MKQIYRHQRNEITEYFVYKKLAEMCSHPKNKETLNHIAQQELTHYNFWRNITRKDFKPNKAKIRRHVILSKIFGISFSLRLLEMGEIQASKFYETIEDQYPGVKEIKEDELQHEQELIDILTDYRLIYAGSIVLGLNDALVEFTGTLAGLTFAFNNNKLVGATRLVMGFAASLSMAASGYLASKEGEELNEEINPVTAAVYTGVSYILTVGFLVLPYLLQDDPYIALGLMLLTTVLIISGYTYYISVAKAISFKRRFVEMAVISLGVALISYGIGTLIKHVFGINT